MRHCRSSGPVWQGRFKAFPTQEDDHLLVVLRYIERNPLRAGLVQRAEEWEWSSLRWFATPERSPVPLEPRTVPRDAGKKGTAGKKEGKKGTYILISQFHPKNESCLHKK